MLRCTTLPAHALASEPSLVVVLCVALAGCASDSGDTAEPESAPRLRDCTEAPGASEERCQLDLPCPGREASCSYRVPDDCGSIAGLECGEMPNRIYFGICLAAHARCERSLALRGGGAEVQYDYVSDYDFQRAALRDLPFDFACSGLASRDLSEWCDYAEAMFPDASFLEALLWRGNWSFEPIGSQRLVGCRMDGGWYEAKEFRAIEGGIECIAVSDASRFGVRLGNDVTFSDVDGNGYLDAVMQFSDGGVVRTVKLTRKDGSSPFSHVDPIEDPLAGLEAQMNKLVGLLAGKLDDARSERVRAEQRSFLETRDARCQHAGPSLDCLAAHHEERIEALRVEAWERRCDMFDADPCSGSLPLPASD